GYPQATLAAISSRLASSDVVAAHIDVPVVDAPGRRATFPLPGLASAANALEKTTQRVVPDDRPRYTGRVYVLIDERAISQSEHSALFFKAAGATLVGSNSAG